MLSNGQNSVSLTNNTDEFYLSRSMLYTLSGAGDNPEQEAEFSIADRLCMRFPTKLLATITFKATDSNEFCVSFVDDPRDFKIFDEKLQDYYEDSSKRTQVEINTIPRDEEFVCVCEFGSRYFRCRLMESFMDNDEMKFKVYLFDVGAIESVTSEALFEAIQEFFSGDFHYAFSLKCSTPDAETLKRLKLPTLDDFSVGEVIDILLCSIHEPCLALVGSRSKHFMRLRPQVMTQGLDLKSAEIWNKLFLLEKPSEDAIHQGQLPVAQPTITGDWSFMTVANIVNAEEIYVRDFFSMLRLSVINEVLNEFYNCPVFSEKLRINQPMECVSIGLPCVVFNGIQFVRGEIVAHSSDRSVVDVRCVDYPQIFVYDQKVHEDKIFLLSETYNVPPQCFPVRICECKSENVLNRYTSEIISHVNIGSMVVVRGWPRSTKVTMKGDDNADLLTLVSSFGGCFSDMSELYGGTPTPDQISFS